jgi:multisubunit Na+/H+ antiporter MnhG subunit
MANKTFLHFLTKDPITPAKIKDTGLVIILIMLICFLISKNLIFIKLALSVTIITIIIPVAIKPFALIWFGLAELLGAVMSKVLLILVFFFIITPIGTLRRLLARERLQMELWKKETGSVFIIRDKRFTADDINNPF